MSLKSNVAIKLGLTDINDRLTKLYNISFAVQKTFDFNYERKTLLSRVRNYTHVNYQRLGFLYDVAEKLAQLNTEGAFVETGVWKGGCAGILAHISKKHGYKQPLYFFDSFEGLPEPTIKDGADAEVFSENLNTGNLASINKVSAGIDFIQDLLFNKLQIDSSKVNIIKGWFQDTLPEYKGGIGKISLLRLDGDWYESTKVAIDNLYDNVVSGGYIIIDDYYYWDGCKKAIDEFLQEKNLNAVLRPQDTSGAYFVKP